MPEPGSFFSAIVSELKTAMPISAVCCEEVVDDIVEVRYKKKTLVLSDGAGSGCRFTPRTRVISGVVSTEGVRKTHTVHVWTVGGPMGPPFNVQVDHRGWSKKKMHCLTTHRTLEGVADELVNILTKSNK